MRQPDAKKGAKRAKNCAERAQNEKRIRCAVLLTQTDHKELHVWAVSAPT